MAAAWNAIFDNFGVKRVTKTDKGKSAYVPTLEQRVAIEAAGIKPGTTRPAPAFDVVVLFDPQVNSVKASYYHSERSDEAMRPPESRMGHGIISTWLNQGDEVVIGNIGSQVFAIKLTADNVSEESVTQEIVKRASRKTIFARAKQATGRPKRRVVEREEFVRDPYVVAAAILRSNGKCEMPGCACTLFTKDDGNPYLEVHHVEPLGTGGDDTLVNAAAICPQCHRELHFGDQRKAKLRSLKAYITALPIP